MSNLLKGKSKSRDPPPTLFHSPSASHVSLPGAVGLGLGSGVGGAPPPLSTSAFTTTTSPPLITTSQPGGPSRTTGGGGGGLGLNINLPLPVPSLRSRESTRTTDRTDALWAEMQATLEAVELSAGAGAAGGSGSGSGAQAVVAPRVFGPDHERKLDELRSAQIALAQAWARSEADEAIETTGAGTGAGGLGGAAAGEGGGGGGGGMSEGRSVATDVGGGGGGGGGVGGKSTVGTGSARPGSSGVGMGVGSQEKPGGTKMEEETEVDILLARKRREANDRYFHRVNQGVLDVVAKLEEVAIAMREVEQESKELWGDDNESSPGSAKT
ncbi:hypothetical protein C8A00DRAFT_14941 [Chaetomidium leptoderma]|uniref:Uncharacterized protein n=1 Tax=Chaetomidium leptoderma TaxID=669021 RepID=A0AAN6VP94_9PEZI|nr:hypothetical protein C8A00DRAFT_14941 [Chaetomidium leptoderma]